MKTRNLLFLGAILFAPAALALAAPNAESERIGASFALALGRAPTSAELADAGGNGAGSVSDRIARHRQRLERDAALQRSTATQAWTDAFGRQPADRDLAAAPAGAETYTERVQQHIRQLAGNPAEYRQVIERAYQRVLRRPAYDIEVEYWEARDALPFVLLVGCIENWALRNAPGLMATTGIPSVSVNSNYLSTLRLSAAVATEARAAIGLAAPGDADLVSATGRTLVAAGAGQVVSVGRIHFVATGGPNLLP